MAAVPEQAEILMQCDFSGVSTKKALQCAIKSVVSHALELVEFRRITLIVSLLVLS